MDLSWLGGVLFIGAFVLVIAIFAISIYNGINLFKYLRQRGIRTMAKITHRSDLGPTVSSGGMKRQSKAYSFTVEYTVNDKKYKRSVGVSQNEYHRLEVGSEIELVYLPENPKAVVLASQLGMATPTETKEGSGG